MFASRRARVIMALAGSLLAACGGQPAPANQKANQNPTQSTPKANGTLSAWQTLAPLLTPRANHCAVATQGYLFVLGGNYEDVSTQTFVNIGTVDAAQLMPDGSLGPWKQVGTLPGTMSQCTATADATHLYIVDALYDDDATYGRQLWQAPVAADGTVGSWKSLATLPGTLRVLEQQAWVSGTRLIAMTSSAPPDGNGTEALELDVGATSPSWTEYPWTTVFRGWPQYAFDGAFAWSLGGYSDGATDADADGDGTALSASGMPGTAFPVTTLPRPTTAGAAAAVDGYVFLFGGKASIEGDGTAIVDSTPIAQDGTLGKWSVESSLPHGRDHFPATVAGDFVYVTGGGYDAGGLDTVYAARIRF